MMAAKEISVKKYVVRLSDEERERLEALIRKGKSPAQRLLKARKVGLGADRSHCRSGPCIRNALSCETPPPDDWKDGLSSPYWGRHHGAARRTTLPDDTRRAQPNREVKPSELAESLLGKICDREITARRLAAEPIKNPLVRTSGFLTHHTLAEIGKPRLTEA
jgi:hypothetical protein